MQFDSANKDGAHNFLDRLKANLIARLPPLNLLRASVREIAAASKTDNSKAYLRGPESAFLNRFVIPEIYELIRNDGMDVADARQSFLCEGYTNPELSRFCSGTPARSERHPFTKAVVSDASEIMRKWEGNIGSPLTQACPDFALRNPFAYKIVFEGKYFEQGNPSTAARDLVTNIYQAFYYRSLPYVAAKKSMVPWDYDYACLLAYDASPEGTLSAAWNNLANPVRDGFWNGANVYVMILRDPLLA
jgi:hypothetical protein